ncbi:MAG: aminotransferase class V-fold PLP-dependent enzyme [Pseudomonadota bacterium]
MNHAIYLDGNATSPVLPAAIDAAVRAMRECYGNPSSGHSAGLRARALLDGARRRAVRLLGAGSGRLMFNSGATEGIQSAVLSALCALRERRAQGEDIGTLLVYGATEHKAVPESLAHWNRLLGLHLRLAALPVDGDGLHDLPALRALAPQAALVCTMAANNETGIVSDLAGIERVLNETRSQAYWLVDCVQALGKMKLDLARTRIDYAPFSGHKLYAPKGIGMLYVRDGAPYTPLIVGGGQEAALRSGTENTAGVAALDAVLAALEQGDVLRGDEELHAFRAQLADALRAAFPAIVFNAPFAQSLPTTLNFSVPGLSSRELTDVFDAAGVSVSAGSACSSAKAAPSHVLEAMGLPQWRSASAIRISFGALTDADTIAEACRRIARCGTALSTGGLFAAGGGQAPGDGVLQLGSGAQCSWLVQDAASRACVVIDPQPEFAERIAAGLHGQGYQVLAVLGTTPGADLTTLSRALNLPPALDAFGWPADGDVLALGGQLIRRIACGTDRFSYLLGTETDSGMAPAAVRHAFIGDADPRQLAALLDPDTLLCAARDAQQPFCSSLRAGQLAAPESGAPMQLDAGALQALLLRRPDAVLVDVRERHEYAAGAGTQLAGRTALSVPLARLTGHVAGWLRGAGAPLIFVCRSGARSAKAAHCLRRLGYQHAYTLEGGIALV